MSTKIKMLLPAIVLVSLSSVSLAFSPPPNNSGPGSRMAKKLNLTTEQQQQFQRIIKQQREEGQAWREKHRKAAENKLSAVLNEEQLAKFKTMKQQRANQRGNRRNKPRNNCRN